MARLTNCFFSPSLGLEDLGIYKGLDRFLIDILRDQDFIGDQVGFLLIKLSHIGQRNPRLDHCSMGKIDVALNQLLALTDKEDLHTHPALVHVVAKDIRFYRPWPWPAVWSAGSRWPGSDPRYSAARSNSMFCAAVFILSLRLIDNLVILPLEEVRNLLGHALEIGHVLVADCVEPYTALNGSKSRPWKADWCTCGKGKSDPKAFWSH